MKNKYIALSAIAIAGIVGSYAISQTAFAYRGNPDQIGPNYSPERHTEMEKAFEKNDYSAWKEQMNGRGQVTKIVNEQNFARFAEMRKLMFDKKYDEANKIRAELGLGQGNGQRKRQGRSSSNFVDKNGDGTCDNRQ
jgi:hypothetical protein